MNVFFMYGGGVPGPLNYIAENLVQKAFRDGDCGH